MHCRLWWTTVCPGAANWSQLELLYSLNSKAIQDPPAFDDLDCDTVLREKIYKVTGNNYTYSPTPHSISFSCEDCSALSAPCSTGSSHCTVGSGGPLSDLDQWEPLISVDSKAIEGLLAMEEDLAQANSISPETAILLAPVTCALGLASCFPYNHFLVSANEWQDIFTGHSNMREMNEVEQCSTLVLTPAVNHSTVHLCVALQDCTLSVLLTRLHGGFRATGKLHFGAGGWKLASNIIAWIHQLRGNTFASSATTQINSIAWKKYGSQHALNYILCGSQCAGSSAGQLSCSDRVDSSLGLILTLPVQLAINQLTLALQVCNHSGLFTKRHGNVVPVGQLLKAKALSQMLSTMTSLQDIRVIPSCRNRKALQLASGSASINVPAQLSVDNTGHNIALSITEESLLPHKDCSSRKEEPTNHCSKTIVLSDVTKEMRCKETKRLAALPVDENVLPQNKQHSLLCIDASALHPSAN